MFKKTLWGSIGAALVLGLLFGRGATSYLRTGFGWMRDSVKESVPVSLEIERARRMITDLTPEIRRNMHQIAREEVELQQLSKQLQQLLASQEKGRAEMSRLAADLETGRESFVYGSGRTYTIAQVKVDLKNRLDRCKTIDGTVDNLHKVLAAREQGLAAARAKLDEMLAAKKQLAVDLESLEARRKMLDVQQTASDINLDNSQLARTKELVHEIASRLDVTEKLLEADAHFVEQIPVDQPQLEDVSAQVAEYLHGNSGPCGNCVAETQPQ